MREGFGGGGYGMREGFGGGGYGMREGFGGGGYGMREGFGGGGLRRRLRRLPSWIRRLRRLPSRLPSWIRRRGFGGGELSAAASDKIMIADRRTNYNLDRESSSLGNFLTK